MGLQVVSMNFRELQGLVSRTSGERFKRIAMYFKTFQRASEVSMRTFRKSSMGADEL